MAVQGNAGLPMPSHSAGPSDHENTQIPAGETTAAAVHTNGSTGADDSEGAAGDAQTPCAVHLHKNLELFCVKCDSLICMDCKLSEHLHHESRTLEEAAGLATDQLTCSKIWLETAVVDLESNLEKRKTDRMQFRDKKAVVERELRRRHTALLTAAGQYLEEALGELGTACEDIDSTHSKDMETVERNLNELHEFQRKIDQAEKEGKEHQIVTLAKEMKLGHVNADCIKLSKAVPHLKEIARPVHHSRMPEDDTMFDSMKNFIGSAHNVVMRVTEPELSVVEQFRCDVDDDTTVFCVCPVDNGTVWVSFESPLNHHRKLPSKRFTEEGKLIRTLKSFRNGGVEPAGRISIKERRGFEKIMFCVHEDHSPSAYAKSRSRRMYKMERSSKDTYVGVTQIVSENPELVTCQVEPFSISCCFHRAFDVDDSENLFAVVTEARDPSLNHDVRGNARRDAKREAKGVLKRDIRSDVQRDVKLYRRDVYKPVNTYASPIVPYQPADVCFFVLHGQGVLLIADEFNDVIHVVHVQSDCLIFSRFLSAGYPLLLQPTALNTDHKGRLWVGCRGGRLLTFTEPLPPAAVAVATNSLQH